MGRFLQKNLNTHLYLRKNTLRDSKRDRSNGHISDE